MRVADSMQAVKMSAAEALKTLLRQVSQIKLKSIDADLKGDILAHVDVHGHSHTLVCKVRASGRPEHIRMALKEFQVDGYFGDATPVLIAPFFSEESRTLCRNSRAGYLDLEGNARLELGEVFIGASCLPRIGSYPVASVPVQSLEEYASRFNPFRPDRVAEVA